MTENTGAFITNLIQTVVFMTPVILIFYRQGKKDQVIDEVVKDVNGLGKKVAEIRDQQTETLVELKAQIDSMNTTLIRVTTSLEFMSKTLEDLKNRKD